jgi:shikimate kinase
MKDVSLRLGDRFLVLVGLMGAGKSSIGRMLADEFRIPFIDADDEIEKAAGCSIKEIFRLYGEPAFRDGERRVIARILERGPGILATGGGAFMDTGTREAIRERGISIWLHADPGTLFRRTRRRSVRPLLENEDPLGTLERLARERYPVYAEADITIETGKDKPTDTVRRIIAEIEGRAALAGASGEE